SPSAGRARARRCSSTSEALRRSALGASGTQGHGMHRSIATVSLSGTLRQKLEAVAAARFDGIELFENDFIQFAGSATDVRAIAGDLGLSIDLYQPFRDFEAMPEAAYRRSLDRAERKFDLM